MTPKGLFIKDVHKIFRIFYPLPPLVRILAICAVY